MIQLPTTAPSGESNPPSAAPANAYTSTPPIRLTSRNSRGATSTPASAPSNAARPQPSISMRPTRMPTRRLESGFSAAARIARPSLVRWNSSPSSATTASSTAMIPSDSIESSTPPSRATPLGKMDGKPRLVNPQIQPAAALTRMNRPRVTITRVSVQAPRDEGGEHRHLALGEVHDAGRAEDQHQRQRQRAVDRPVGDPVDHDLQEPFHRPPQYPR